MRSSLGMGIAWMHAASHRLFRTPDEKRVHAFEGTVRHAFADAGLGDENGREDLITDIAAEVADAFGLDTDSPQLIKVYRLVQGLMDSDHLFVLPYLDWSTKEPIAQIWEHEKELKRQEALIANFDTNRHLIKHMAGLSLQQLYEGCPSLFERDASEDGLTIETHLLDAISNLPKVVDTLVAMPFVEDVQQSGMFEALRFKLESNSVLASGGDPANPKDYKGNHVFADKFQATSSAHLVETYLSGTPFAPLFDQQVAVTMPTKTRFEHMHMVAGSGHGKTQTLQAMVVHDLEHVMRGERSIVVIDSQSDLINNIASLEVFAPGGPLHDRLVLIDPSDVEFPVSLNLFDVGQDRLKNYALVDRERLTNSILELYDFVLGTLLDAQMTQKQSVIFRFVTRLMLHIPGATIHTLRELMEPGAEETFAEHIAKLSGTSQHFFASEFASREFEQTKRQVLRRLCGILENQTFERMFSHPKSKLDLFAEMNAGKVILINTAKDLLKENGTQIFGRFFIAMIAQAAQERSILPAQERMPTFVYVDEAADYFDRNIEVILAQARKYNVGMVLAHQFLGQLDHGLQASLSANTSIKLAGGVSAKDARELGSMMRCDPKMIEAQDKGHFAAYMRGVQDSAIPLRFPFGVVEGLPRMDRGQHQALRSRIRGLYSVPIDELVQVTAPAATPSLPNHAVPSSDNEIGSSSDKGDGHIDTDPSDQW